MVIQLRQFLIFALLFCLVLSTAYARKPQLLSDEILMECDSFQLDEKNHILTTENSIITYKDIKIYAPFGKYNLKTQIGILTGGIKINYPDSVITSSRMEIFYLEKRCILTGNVNVVSKRVLGKLEDKKITMSCQRLEYFMEQRKSKASGNVKIFQEKGIIFCNYADYDQNNNVAHLIGNVRFEYYKGDWLTCQEAWANLEKETFSAKDNVRGRFLMESPKAKEEVEEKVLAPKPAYMPLEPAVSEIFLEN